MKIAKLMAASAVLALGLAACGGEEPPATDTPEQKAEKLVVWRFGEKLDEHVEFMDKANAAYEKQTGTKVEVQWVPWPDVEKKLTAAAAGGEGPDVTEIGNTQVNTWAAQDTLADITDKVAEWKEGQEIPENLWVNETIDGKKYAVPWLGGVRAVIYRKDWFEELKIEIPKNWDELLAAAKTIAEKKKGASGFEINGGSDSMHAFAPFVWGNGGDIVADQGGKWASQLNSPQAKEALTWYTNLVTTEKVSPKSALTRNSVDISRLFGNNKVGMFVDGSWAKGAITDSNKKMKDKQIGAFPLPGKDGGVAGQFAGGNDLAVWNDSKVQNDAFEYIKFLAGKEQTEEYAPIAGLLPLYPDLLASDTYTKDEWLSPFAEAMPQGRAYAVNENWVKVEETVAQQMLNDVVKGKKTADEAADEAAKNMDAELNK